MNYKTTFLLILIFLPKALWAAGGSTAILNLNMLDRYIDDIYQRDFASKNHYSILGPEAPGSDIEIGETTIIIPEELSATRGLNYPKYFKKGFNGGSHADYQKKAEGISKEWARANGCGGDENPNEQKIKNVQNIAIDDVMDRASRGLFLGEAESSFDEEAKDCEDQEDSDLRFREIFATIYFPAKPKKKVGAKIPNGAIYETMKSNGQQAEQQNGGNMKITISNLNELKELERKVQNREITGSVDLKIEFFQCDQEMIGIFKNIFQNIFVNRLSFRRLSDEIFVPIMQALETSGVKELNVANCKITSKGIEDALEFIKKNYFLEELDLSTDFLKLPLGLDNKVRNLLGINRFLQKHFSGLSVEELGIIKKEAIEYLGGEDKLRQARQSILGADKEEEFIKSIVNNYFIVFAMGGTVIEDGEETEEHIIIDDAEKEFLSKINKVSAEVRLPLAEKMFHDYQGEAVKLEKTTGDSLGEIKNNEAAFSEEEIAEAESEEGFDKKRIEEFRAKSIPCLVLVYGLGIGMKRNVEDYKRLLLGILVENTPGLTLGGESNEVGYGGLDYEEYLEIKENREKVLLHFVEVVAKYGSWMLERGEDVSALMRAMVELFNKEQEQVVDLIISKFGPKIAKQEDTFLALMRTAINLLGEKQTTKIINELNREINKLDEELSYAIEANLDKEITKYREDKRYLEKLLEDFKNLIKISNIDDLKRLIKLLDDDIKLKSEAKPTFDAKEKPIKTDFFASKETTKGIPQFLQEITKAKKKLRHIIAKAPRFHKFYKLEENDTTSFLLP